MYGIDTCIGAYKSIIICIYVSIVSINYTSIYRCIYKSTVSINISVLMHGCIYIYEYKYVETYMHIYISIDEIDA